MKIIEMKLKDSLIEAVKEIQIDESDIVWIEMDKAVTQAEFQRIQNVVSESFPVNRVIVVPQGCKLRFDKPEKEINKMAGLQVHHPCGCLMEYDVTINGKEQCTCGLRR